ncbi:BppU family phage baseplate upper protein [Clostridium perfringens]|nr:BppU family phage baseplate upper protein [Clostridium perfringens]
MKEIYINADDYNSDSISTIQGNNNAEEYKIYLQYDNEKIDLTNKTVNLAFLKVGSTEGDIIENLNVTNPKEGEITLKITNKISKRNGTYSCQLAILGEGDFLEHTATFTLTVENNIFSDITKAIADSKDFTYLENILDKASKLSEKLKENTSTATNANSNLESNITEANNINSKLLENTSTATSLNKNLESNIDLAKEVKETIKDLDTKNIEATSKIERLEGLNAKAEELSNNINEALPVKDALVKNTEEAKAANTNLLAVNQEATSKNTELQASLEKTKEFIEGLDGSQNIPQIRMDVTELQNGLKSNQALAYQGASIDASNTLEGRTESMKIKGKTMYKKKDGTYTDTWEEGVTLESFGEAESNKISILSSGKNFFKSYKSKSKGNTSIFNIENDNVTIGTNQSPSWTNASINYGKLKIGSKYTVSCESFTGGVGDKVLFAVKKYRGRDEVGAYGDITKSSLSLTFTVVDDADIVLRFFVNNATPINTPTSITYNNIQIIEGVKTDYAPSIIDKKDILIKEPLRSVGDIADVMHEDNGQVKINRVIGHHTFTGDETITQVENNSKAIIVITNNIRGADFKHFISNKNIGYDVRWNVSEWENDYPIAFNFVNSSKGYVTLLFSKTKIPSITDINSVKQYLRENNLELYYKLATPTVDIVENCVDIDLDTFGEKTYFNILNSLPGTLDFKVPSNIASIVQSNSKAINELYNLIDTLVLPNILQNTTDIEMLKLEKLK